MLNEKEKQRILAMGKALVKITLSPKGKEKPACNTLVIKRGENNTGKVVQCSPFPLWEGWTCTNFCNLTEGSYPEFSNDEGACVKSAFKVKSIKYLID